MNATVISFDRSVRRASMMVFGALTLAACDNDRTVGPSSAAVPKATMAKLSTRMSYAKWTVADMNNVPVGGAVFSYDDGSGVVLVADNSALDLDKTPGQFHVKAPNHVANICPVTSPKGWVILALNVCYGMPVAAGQTIFMGTFGANPQFSAYWYTSDGSTLVGPAAYTVKAVSGRFAATIGDDDKNDRWAGLGSLWIQLPAAGDYEICQVKAAPGTALANPACRTVTVTLGDPAYANIFVSN